MASAGDRLQIVLAAKNEISAEIKQTKSDLTSLGRTAGTLAERMERGEQGLQNEYEQTRLEIERNRQKLISLGRQQADINRKYRELTTSGKTAAMNLTRAFDTVTRKLGMTEGKADSLRRGLERLDNGAYAFRTKWSMALTSVERRMAKLRSSQAFMGLMSFARGGAAAIGLIGAAGATMGLTTKAQMENQQIALEQLLGTKRKAAETMKWIMQTANETPFGMTDITNATQKLLGFGFSLDETKKKVLTIGDVAAGTGTGAEGIDQITRALGQMQAKQKITGEEMMQLTEAGIPAWKILAEQMGMSTKELMDMASSQGGGSALFNMGGLDKLFGGLDKQYGGVMAKQAKTLGGRWSTFTDTLRTELAKLFDGKTGKALRNLLKWAAEQMPHAFKFLRKSVRGFTNIIDDNWPAIVKLGRGIGWVFKNIVGPVLKYVVELFQGMFYVIVKLVKFLVNAWDGIKTAGKAVADWFRSALDAIGNAFTSWSGAIRNVLNTVIGWLNKIPGVNIDLITDPSAIPTGRWMGGPVDAGQSYLVGEIGPELFVPNVGEPQMIGTRGMELRDFNASGVIIPNALVGSYLAATGSGQSPAGATVNIGTINASADVDVEAAVLNAQLRADRIARERR